MHIGRSEISFFISMTIGLIGIGLMVAGGVAINHLLVYIGFSVFISTFVVLIPLKKWIDSEDK